MSAGTLLQQARMNVLSLRREVARSRRGTLWHHLRLDGGAAVIALTAYGLSVYLNTLGEQLDIGTKTLFSAPLTIVASIFLIIGILILFLRLFPFLLRLGAWFTARRRSAAPMFARRVTQRA
jgi:putative exporter of polyketide antibiotics